MRGISRRALLAGMAVVGAGGSAVLGMRFHGSTSTGMLLRSSIPLPKPFSTPLTTPPVLAPVTSTTESQTFEITQRMTETEIIDGLRTPIWGYDGVFPGPTIVSHRGRRTRVRHRNELPVPTVAHLHGGRTAPEHDGYPTDLVLPTGKAADADSDHAGDVSHGVRTYQYDLEQRAATLWYHDHRMDFTGPAVWRGLAGLHIVTDDAERDLPLPDGDRDLPLIITDRAFAEDGSMPYPSIDDDLVAPPGVHTPYEAGVLGDVVLVNGRPWPYHEVDAARYRLRFLNASNARRYRLMLDPAPSGVAEPFVQIGSDGGLLRAPLVHPHLDLAPAERQEVIVDFATYDVGQKVRLVNDFGEGSTRTVMEFRVVRRATDASEIPAVLSDIEPLAESAAVRERDLVFRSDTIDGHHGWTINGEPFSGRPPARHTAAR